MATIKDGSLIVIVSLTEQPLLSVTVTTNATCGFNDGTATIAPTGGTGPIYTYNWTTLGGLGIPNPTGLAAGTYPVIITDGNNCQQSFLIPISNVV